MELCLHKGIKFSTTFTATRDRISWQEYGSRIYRMPKAFVERFDDFQFAVDSTNPDTTLRLSGREMKAAIGTPKHTHAIEEVTGLPGELEKKLDKTGGTMTGDLRIEGDTHVRNLRVDEYLEVPELKYNRITATGNEFWVTDGGTVTTWPRATMASTS